MRAAPRVATDQHGGPMGRSDAVWTWRTRSKTRRGGPPCCRWRRFGCAWHSAMSRRKHPISSIDESSPERPPWRLSPRPAPFRPIVYGAARSWPRGPDGGIPPQTAGIALWVPCQEQPGIRRPVPEYIAGYADGTLAPTSVVAGPFGPAAAWGEEGLLRSRPATSLTCRKACEAKWRFAARYREGWGDGNTFSALLRVAA